MSFSALVKKQEESILRNRVGKVTLIFVLMFSLISISPIEAAYQGDPAVGDERVVLLTPGPGALAGCTGALIAPRVVFSAAHCADGVKLVYSPNAAISNTESAVAVSVRKTFVASDYLPAGSRRGPIQDFMVLILESDLADVEPMRVATFDDIARLMRENSDVIQIGYGVKELAPYPNKMERNFPTRIVSKLRGMAFTQDDVAKQLIAQNPLAILNTLNSPDKTMCGGDSGSPLYSKDGADYIYIGAMSAVNGIACHVALDNPMRMNPFWQQNTAGVYFPAAGFKSLINEAEDFLRSEIAREKSIADELALKAKQEADAKAALELVAAEAALKARAAEKLAADLLRAKEGSQKKKTIICTKAKSIMKVSALKPKCPAGYKRR